MAASPTELRVLVLAPSGRDALVAAEILAGVGVVAEQCASLTTLADCLHAGAGAVLLAEEAMSPSHVPIVIAALQAQPPWSDLPIIMLTTGGMQTATSRRAVALLERHANLTLLERPVRRMTLIAAVHAALRARRRQYVMREQLEERKALLEQAERSRALAERANRAKDEFLAMLSHELRSPLQGMRGWIAVMRRPEIGDAQRERALNTIDRIVDAQAQLVNDLLDVSRIAAGKLELERTSLDLGGLVRGVVDETQPNAEAKGIALSCRIGNGGVVMGDAERLRQVLANLLSNALKFTPAGGQVAVECTADSGSALVTVRDTGHGIAPEFLPHVFERFTQADTSSTRRHGGLGLGLAIARHLVELHGGTIAAHSTGTGQGATFTVRLPIAHAVAPASLACNGNSPGPGVELHGMTVLLVEDDEIALEAMTILLQQHGARVVAAGSVADALDSFASILPDVVVSDISMPDEDGYALLARVRALHHPRAAHTPAVALTGFATPGDRARIAAAGFQAHIAKPADPIVLVTTLRSIVRRAA